ncbi:hypothetical protein [Demequina sp. NBRC 110056]|uniref:hypothetical protein n=1 Tax=Demequina sp. NBRC 110056 TaxID=1570345 RepID=UPI0009FDBC68|nr:hypothetical protein [Demequina sp. NBRC 110056]
MSQTTAEQQPPATSSPTSLRRTLALSTGLTAIIAIVLLAFSWPALTSEPRGIDLALVGPEAAVEAVQPLLTEQAGETFEITVVADREAAVTGIEERDYTGAIVLGPEPELLTASASGTVNQAIVGLAEPLEAALAAESPDGVEATLTVTDVVPLSADDPNGALLTSAFFPILFGGMIGGIALSIAVAGSHRRVIGVTVYSVVGGLVLTGILQGWFGAIQGDFLTNWAAFSLAIGAIAAPIIGCVALIGRAGIAVGPVVMMLFANPISGAALPTQFLPGAWGTIGQWFPPGASATLIRELSYFPNAAMAQSWLVLAAWFVGGIALALVGHARDSRTTADLEPAASVPGDAMPVDAAR